MQFHWYGFIVGLATLIGFLLAEKKALSIGISERFFSLGFFWTLVGGIIGARSWHVWTDFYLYRDNLLDIFYVWQGGLSILGAIFGGFIGLYLFLFFSKKLIKKNLFLDSVVFGFPVAQSIGRVANAINQELYGLPTDLPWKIFIPFEKRLAGFEEFSHFHPLFLYEGLMVMIGWLILVFFEKNKRWQLGSGKFFLWYLMYYGIIRFFLDFLRIDRSSVYFGLGVNQWSILCIELFLTYFWLRKNNQVLDSCKCNLEKKNV